MSKTISFFVHVGIFSCILNELSAVKIHRSECRRDGMFNATDRDMVLRLEPKNVIDVSTTESLSVCARRCTSHIQGRSFNFKKKGNSNCQILDFDKSNRSASVASAYGWIHYEPIDQACNFESFCDFSFNSKAKVV